MSRHAQVWRTRLNSVSEGIEKSVPFQVSGRITRAAGMILEAVGLQIPVGGVCRIELKNGTEVSYAEAEVVGFSDDRLFLMPLEEISGLQSGARILPLNGAHSGQSARTYPLGDSLLGRVVDGGGKPLDGKGPIIDVTEGVLNIPLPNPLNRAPIKEQIDVGVRAINGLLSVGRGQRMGLFAGSGVGKSVLLGMMARYTTADVIVVGLIGERGREVQDFIDNILGEDGIRRAVVVAAPADESPLKRLQGASYATRLAEDFRDQGRSVLLIMDSLTRYAMAQREIALAIGEPPATKGYPPSVFAKLPKLVERTGNGPRGGGSITAFYTVLTEGDDQQDPIADSARAILDGHIVLSRRLAESGHYPAIDIEASISRVMVEVVSKEQLQKAQAFKQALSTYQRNRDLINVGAYTIGRDREVDQAIHLYPNLAAYLQQPIHEKVNMGDASSQLFGIIR